MVIYRPHRGGLKESMEEAIELPSREAVKDYVCEQAERMEGVAPFQAYDISFGAETADDTRIGWHDTRYVLTRRYFNETFIPPIPIGFCAEDYEK